MKLFKAIGNVLSKIGHCAIDLVLPSIKYVKWIFTKADDPTLIGAWLFSVVTGSVAFVATAWLYVWQVWYYIHVSQTVPYLNLAVVLASYVFWTTYLYMWSDYRLFYNGYMKSKYCY